jgi:hypothetical protein
MRAVFVALAVLAGAASTSAHHSYAQFDQDRTVSVEGTIQSVLYANPHVVLTVQTKDNVVYTATWRAAMQLNRQGVDRAHLKAGDTIAISGNPARDAAVHELSRISVVRRPSDGWVWRLNSDR